MKIYRIEGPVVEPAIEGTERTFAYIDDKFIALTEGSLPAGNEAEELDWQEDRAVRDEVLGVIRAVHKIGNLDPVERAVYDALRAPTEDEVVEAFVASVREQVTTRIVAVASLSTQINMSAMAAGGLFDEDQLAAYQAGLAWVAETRAKGKELARKGLEDFADDSHWPVVPANAAALAELF